MSDLIKSTTQYKPRYIPYLGDVDWCQINRAQNLDPSSDFPSEKLEELGTDGKLGDIKETSVIGCSLTQREHDSLDFYLALANKASGDSVTLADFAASAGDICTYLTNKDDEIVSTLWYPRQRLVSLGLSIGDPKAIVDRSFTFTGEDALILQTTNKYLIFKKYTVESGEAGSGVDVEITLDDPIAVENPDKAGKFMLRVTKYTLATEETAELVEGTDYTSTADTLTVTTECAVGDVIKYYYSSASWVTTPALPFITNELLANAIRANSVVLYLGSAGRLHKVQSASLSVDLSREDILEIGSEDIVERSVLDNAVSVDLGKLLDTDMSLEEILRGNTTGILDSKNYVSDLTFMIAVYSDSTHETFKLGYKVTNMTPGSARPGTGAIGANVDSGVTLKSDNLLITTKASDLGL